MDTPDSTTLKRCTKCGELKPLEVFHRNTRTRDGLNHRCKDCRQKYYKENSARILEQKREYYQANTERICQRQREFRQAHPDHVHQQQRNYRTAQSDERRQNQREYQRQYREAHAEERRQYQKAYNLTYNKVNMEKIRQRAREYYQSNKAMSSQRAREYNQRHPEVRRNASIRRRARVQGADGSFTTADIESIRKAQGNRCYLCGKKLKKYHIDHFIPLALGGTNAPGNLRLACPKCNLSKGAKHPFVLGRLL